MSERKRILTEKLQKGVIMMYLEYPEHYSWELFAEKVLSKEDLDLSKIKMAYEYAAKAHENQFRNSGEAYIVHPLAVAYSTVELNMDTDSVCAALLHDVLEDNKKYQLDDIKSRFGDTVAFIVSGLTNVEQNMSNAHSHDEKKVKEFIDVIQRSVFDIRILFIKLCDRLHNMRTIDSKPKDKQRETAYHSRDYAYFAHYLGVNVIADELETRALSILDPESYAIIHAMRTKEDVQKKLDSIVEDIENRLKKERYYDHLKIVSRVKSVHSYYEKLKDKGYRPEDIYDFYGVRILCDERMECYEIYGVMSEIFSPCVGRFKDYISNPKENGYRSIQSTFIRKRDGMQFEIQIRTKEMDLEATYGICSHTSYKGDFAMKITKSISNLISGIMVDDANPIENMSNVKNNARNQITVITPKGEYMVLPKGATPIDFAYKIHDDIGNRFMGAKVEGKLVSMETELQQNDQVEIIISSQDKAPNPDWLKCAKTPLAKNKIRYYLRKLRRPQNIIDGRKQLELALKRKRVVLTDAELMEYIAFCFPQHMDKTDEFFESIIVEPTHLDGYVSRLTSHYMELNREQQRQDENLFRHHKDNDNPILIDNNNDIEVNFAKCCYPVPGDEIVAFITCGHGLKIHTKKCLNYKKAMKSNDSSILDRWIAAEWKNHNIDSLSANIEIVGENSPNFELNIIQFLCQHTNGINHTTSRVLKNQNKYFEATIMIKNMDQLNNLFECLKKTPGILEVRRAADKE